MKLQLPRSFVTVILFLACVALVLLAQGGPVQACQDGIGSGQEIQVVVGPLLIRNAPDGDIVSTLAVGETFVITEQAEANGYLWAGHARGWSALHALDCSDVFTQSTGVVSASAAPAAEDAPAPPPAGDDNKCYTDWDYCNTGTPDEIAYKWRLGYWTAAQESGMIPEHVEPKELAVGNTESMAGVPMVMPTKAPPKSDGPKPERTRGPEMTPEVTEEGN